MAREKIVVKPKKKKLQLFDVVNYLIFTIVALIIIVPIWKVLVDSFNAVGVYQFQLWPNRPTLDGYKTIIETSKLYQPFLNSVYTTVAGAILGLVLSTLGGYVLAQKELPGRDLIATFLLITMIFSGGMIPEYLVMKELGLVNNMWILVVKHGINVYNVVLMKNFFEGIPESLYEAADLEGGSKIHQFFHITLPLVWGTVRTTLTFFIISSINLNFLFVKIMTGGGPDNASTVFLEFIYNHL
jgi:putative aldouronate transport system permease protein